MLGDISIVSGILRSISKPRENNDIGEMDDQFIIKIESLFIFKEEYVYYISDPDILDLTVSSVSNFFNSSILKRPRDIVYIIFYIYIFLNFYRYATFVSTSKRSIRIY